MSANQQQSTGMVIEMRLLMLAMPDEEDIIEKVTGSHTHSSASALW